MKEYRIKFTNQCNENWNTMTPVDKGRHCAACNKMVIDFTSMKDEDIVAHLLKNKNTCGRFHPKQLNQPIVIFKTAHKSNWPAIAAMLVAGIFSLAPHNLQAIHGGTTLEANHETITPMFDNPTDGEKNNVKTGPRKTVSYFTIHLFDAETKTPILNGQVTIEELGTFFADINGNITIENTLEETHLPSYITVYISTYNYGYVTYTIPSKNLKNTNSANIYLTEQIMPSGTVALEEIPNPKK